ncbi:MAG: DUF5615 family PIN-like protein [Acidobacteriota bacterium]
MPKLRLHLDADTSNRALEKALVEKGHDVSRTPAPWIPFDADDETQLLRATARGRCLFTFNIRDFVVLAERHPQHSGIVLAAQRSWTLSELIAALDRLLTESPEMLGRVEWLRRR